jgi:ornithine cyclodeaminase/thiomorpholine-carboxylate dehydrogenase
MEQVLGPQFLHPIRRKLQVFEAPANFVAGQCAVAELTGRDPAQATNLGDMLIGCRPGRQHDDEITLYTAMGVAMEDLIAAQIVLQKAMTAGAGQAVVL